MELEKGTRIYYSGDMANQEGFGTITKVITSPTYSPSLRIRFDDKRTTIVGTLAFSEEYLGHGGTRFVTEKAYYEWREKQIASFKRRAAEIHRGLIINRRQTI